MFERLILLTQSMLFNSMIAIDFFLTLQELEGMARYASQLLAPVEGFGRAFFFARREIIMLFWPILGHF